MSDPSIQERPPHQQRVIAERESRSGELERLKAFFPTTVFAYLPSEDKGLLRAQAKCMEELVKILDLRISRF